MRLINTRSLILKDFPGEASEPYAILSHRWDSPEQELTYKDFLKGRKRQTSGYKKIVDFCRIARLDGYLWAWVDTCCIDKTSSAELSEAINSMFRWYSHSATCYVYLTDAGPGRPWQESQWWRRGWTLQELIAPKQLVFFNSLWVRIGSRAQLCDAVFNISLVTGIPREVLARPRAFLKYSIAQRMSWAKGRQTARVEDRAYSLLGLLQINMPLLYGEGLRAFRRLQLEILQVSPDESLLAWFPVKPETYLPHGVLASSPDDFYRWGGMRRWPLSSKQTVTYRDRASPPRVTSWGIELRASALKVRALPPKQERFHRARRIVSRDLYSGETGTPTTIAATPKPARIEFAMLPRPPSPSTSPPPAVETTTETTTEILAPASFPTPDPSSSPARINTVTTPRPTNPLPSLSPPPPAPSAQPAKGPTGPICYALTLTVPSPFGGPSSCLEFPCTLILTQRDTKSHIFYRRECIDWKGYNVPNVREFFQTQFRDQYEILEQEEEERVFYLWCGDDEAEASSDDGDEGDGGEDEEEVEDEEKWRESEA